MFEGNTYTSCIPDGSGKWCATSLNSDGSFDNYGYCEENNPDCDEDCTVNGNAGNGTDQGTCFTGSLCQADGTCKVMHCADGILNGDETGLDCGGSCEPCEGMCFTIQHIKCWLLILCMNKMLIYY